jgi:DNA-binding XRE family transcriptional regulator
MNQTEFAEFIGVPRLTTYNRWERQEVQPSIEKAYLISKKLGIHMEELFEEVEE